VRNLKVEFERSLAALQSPAPYAVAVSGGPDSMALMHLAAPLKPLVLTVDHGLRSESADEARFVASAAHDLGLTHLTLRWDGTKPRHGIQAAARHHRYRLMAGECAQRGIATLMTGHTLDDQMETVAMRAARESGIFGLAGMPSQSMLPDTDIRLIRPLLGHGKAVLTGFLRETGLTFLSDPSNQDQRFERARLRAGGVHAVTVGDIGAAQAARRKLERRALAFLEAETVARHDVIMVSRAALVALEPELSDCVLSALLRRVGGRAYPGTRAERLRLMSGIAASTPFAGRTLAAAHIRPARRAECGKALDMLTLLREDHADIGRGWWLPFACFPQIPVPLAERSASGAKNW
jgi:tRNA(Ile)-lysidine synthase